MSGILANPHGGTILVICTGNICRSAYIERRLRQLTDGQGIEISSAGTGALVGHPIETTTRRLLEAAGADTDRFAARDLTRGLLREADLVLAATRAHRAQVLDYWPKALGYTFTLGDLAHVIAGMDPPSDESAESKVAQVARAAGAVRARVMPRAAHEVDIADPYGRDLSAFHRMASRVERDLGPVVGSLTNKGRATQ